MKIEIDEAQAELLLEALHEYIEIKNKAYADCNEGLPEPLTPRDSAIPQLEAIIATIDGMLLVEDEHNNISPASEHASYSDIVRDGMDY